MAKKTHPNHFLKEWRQHRGLSLRKLAARMEQEPGGAEIISHVSLSRIERGVQPYSQPILEALSGALSVSKSALLEMHPEKEGKVIDLVRRLTRDQQDQAIEYLTFLASK